jgi:hypothetical protein
MLHQSPDVEHNLPALQFRQLAERRHPAPGISVCDLPEEHPITLLLNQGKLQVGRVLRFHPGSVLAVAFHAVADEKLAAACGSFRSCGKRIRPQSGFRGGLPIRIGLISRILRHRNGNQHVKGQHHPTNSLHGFRPKSFEILLPTPWIS